MGPPFAGQMEQVAQAGIQQMRGGLPTQQMLAPPFAPINTVQQGGQMGMSPSNSFGSDDYDLVTVTPNGLQVTPLNGAKAPVGLPILEAEAIAMPGQQPPQQPP